MKVCTRCRQDLPLSMFCVNRAQKSGLNPSCKGCQKKLRDAYDHGAWRDANREHVNAYQREYRVAHPEQAQAYREKNSERQQLFHAGWRAANPDRVRANRSKWAATNPTRKLELDRLSRKRHLDKFAAKEARRRFGKRKATPQWATAFFIEEAYHIAMVRTDVTGIAWEVDHMVPLNHPLVCGLHVEHNLAVIPAAKNRSKSNRYWPDMP